nr:MAG TPA: hypothetical protein [Crassvirales sp.]
MVSLSLSTFLEVHDDVSQISSFICLPIFLLPPIKFPSVLLKT